MDTQKKFANVLSKKFPTFRGYFVNKRVGLGESPYYNFKSCNFTHFRARKYSDLLFQVQSKGSKNDFLRSFLDKKFPEFPVGKCSGIPDFREHKKSGIPEFFPTGIPTRETLIDTEYAYVFFKKDIVRNLKEKRLNFRKNLQNM